MDDTVVTEPAKQPSVRESVMQFLSDRGLTTIFGNPGSTELPMFRDFPSEFQYVLGLQESVVVGMADGYSQATRRPALVNLHSAAGVGHAMGNIFTAFKNQSPLIITAGQQSRSILPFDPFLFAAQATDLPRPYVKWACEPARAEDVPLALARAYHVAMQPPCGPVFLSIPADDWERPSSWVSPRNVSYRIGPDPEAIAQVAAALNACRNPAFVVGAGVDRAHVVDKVVALADQHQAAVFAAPMSARCGFPERHPLFAGFLPAMRERIVEQLTGHDLILVLGAPAFSYHIEGQGPHVPEGAHLWQIVDDPQTAAWTPVGSCLVASLQLAVDYLLENLHAPTRLSTVRRLPPPLALSGSPMSVAYAIQSIDVLRAPQDVVVEEAPGSRGVMQSYLPMPGTDSFYTMASGGLGHGMPAAVGIALGRAQMGRTGRVIALIGDGSSMYSIQSLYTAAQLQLSITFVILNNRRYAALQDFASVFGYAEDEVPAGTDLPDLDFVQLAGGQGIPAQRVEHADRLEEVLRHALVAQGPYLIELVVS